MFAQWHEPHFRELSRKSVTKLLVFATWDDHDFASTMLGEMKLTLK